MLRPFAFAVHVTLTARASVVTGAETVNALPPCTTAFDAAATSETVGGGGGGGATSV
jgi:hypothetical protein